MSTYLIGDVHGCYNELMALLKKIDYKRDHDHLIFVGDLINRGPDSLKVLRFVKSLGINAQLVLGNHEVSLIAYSDGIYHGRNSDFAKIMKAEDSQEIIDWLRRKPLLISDDNLGIVVTHAGLPPRWSLKKALLQAQKTQAKLQGKKWRKYLRHAYKKDNDSWSKNFDKFDKFRYRLNAFTRMRYCDKRGDPDLKEKGVIGQQPSHLLPWFEQRKIQQKEKGMRLFFGHWAALGYYYDNHVICIDSGCVFGGALTAVMIGENSIKRFRVALKKKPR